MQKEVPRGWQTALTCTRQEHFDAVGSGSPRPCHFIRCDASAGERSQHAAPPLRPELDPAGADGDDVAGRRLGPFPASGSAAEPRQLSSLNPVRPHPYVTGPSACHRLSELSPAGCSQAGCPRPELHAARASADAKAAGTHPARCGRSRRPSGRGRGRRLPPCDRPAFPRVYTSGSPNAAAGCACTGPGGCRWRNAKCAGRPAYLR